MLKWNRIVIFVDPKVYLIVSVALLLLPFLWVSSWILAVFIHELGHYFAVILCRRNIAGVRIGISGVLMESDMLRPIESVFCSLSGPAASAILILLHGYFPRLAICGFLQTIYNLLPLCPLDGGQALKTIVSCAFGERFASKIILVIEWLIIVVLFFLCVYMTIVLKLGFIPVVGLALFLLKYEKIKIPCKPWRHKVQ